MVLFTILGIGMVAVAIAVILPPLLGKGKATGVARDTLNVMLYKDRLDELEAERQDGGMTDEQYEQSINELRRDLLVNTGGDEDAAPKYDEGNSWVPWAAAAFIPVLTLVTYLYLGSPDLLDVSGESAIAQGRDHTQQQSVTADEMRKMIDDLRARLQENPKDMEGWLLLGRTLVAGKSYGEAAEAFGKAYEIAGDVPDLMIEYAQAIGMAQNGVLEGAPMELVRRVLAVEPNHVEGLWFAGLGAYQQGNFQQAIDYWETLLPQVNPQSQAAQTLQDSLAKAREALGQPMAQAPAAADTGKGVIVEVALSDELKAKAQSGDTVFIFARAPQGPKMPIAAKRMTVAELPIKILLDDSASMTGQKLSTLPEVEVIARVVKSGGVGGASGDLEGSGVVKMGETIELTIDRMIP